MQRLSGSEAVGVHGAFIINHDFFGENALKRVLGLAAGDEVQHSDLALLQTPAADFVGAVYVHSSADVALVVFHEWPAVDDDRHRSHGVAHGAAGQPLGQFIGVHEPHTGQEFGQGFGQRFGQGFGRAGREAGDTAGLMVAELRSRGPGVAEVGAAGAHRAVTQAGTVPLIGGHRAAAGTATSTRQRARGALG